MVKKLHRIAEDLDQDLEDLSHPYGHYDQAKKVAIDQQLEKESGLDQVTIQWSSVLQVSNLKVKPP